MRPFCPEASPQNGLMTSSALKAPLRVVAVLPLTVCMATAHSSHAACFVEDSPAEDASLVRHLSADCGPSERETHAVGSTVVFEAIAKGRAVDLVGVVVHGDLSFDDLPIQVTQTPKGLSPQQEAALSRLNAEEVRIVTAPVMIRDSMVLGAFRHRSSKGTLQFERPVDFRGTVFRSGVDLSRAAFHASVDLSGATFEREAYFVQSQFAHALKCADTKFGPHTRFHRALFRGTLDCSRALFDGMAEFLEVTFEQSAIMENVRFGSGTGFSGSRFKRHVNFADAIFSRDTFFIFAVFEGDALFQGARFLDHADFSDAEFKRPDDLAKVRFDRPPLMARVKRVGSEEAPGWVQAPAVQYMVTVVFLLAGALLVAYAFKLK